MRMLREFGLLNGFLVVFGVVLFVAVVVNIVRGLWLWLI